MEKQRTVTIGLVQMNVPRSKDAALQRAEMLIRRAAKKGAEIICLPELFATPYFPQSPETNAKKYCEPIPDKTTIVMSALARKLKVTIIAPICEKTKSGACFNTAVVFNGNGKMLGMYRKHHIPYDPGFYEKKYFKASDDGYRIFKTRHATFAVLICYDQWFPEAARMVRLKGAEIIFYPTAIGTIIGYRERGDWHNAWETIQRAHAIANSVAIATVNRVGKEGRMRFWGQSFVTDAWGKVLRVASKNNDEVVVQKIDLTYNTFVGEGWGFLRNRRPDTYGALLSKKLTRRSKKLAGVPHYKNEIRALASR